MQKKMLALAACMLCSNAALAQVQLYGGVDYGLAYRYDSLNKKQSKQVFRINAAQSDATFLGLKGSEDLAGGVKVVYQLERDFFLDTGMDRGGGFRRRAFLGLSGNFGTLGGGRVMTPYHQMAMMMDPFANGTVGRYSNVKADIHHLFDLMRVSNAITYQSPKMNGWIVKALFSNSTMMDEESLNNNSANNTVSSLGINYMNQKVRFGASIHRIGMSTNARKTPNGIKTIDNFTVAGAYLFDSFKLSTFYSWDKLNGTQTARFVNKKSIAQNTLMFGASVPINKHVVKTSLNFAHNNSNQYGSAWQWALGYDYLFSKRTKFYAAYALIENDDNRRAVVSDSANKGGLFQQGVQVGMHHKF